MRDHGHEVRIVWSKFIEVRSALRSPGFGVFHFSGHGLSSQSDDPDKSELRLDKGEMALTPRAVPSAKSMTTNKPLVVLNACSTAREGITLAQPTGFAHRFINAGASAFIGTCWDVTDDGAGAFARELYTRLLDGEPLGRATRLARVAAREDGDPSWLAYAAYGHPMAVIVPDVDEG